MLEAIGWRTTGGWKLKPFLKPDFFATVRGFKMFSDIVAEAADLAKARPCIREVMFLDTADFRPRLPIKGQPAPKP